MKFFADRENKHLNLKGKKTCCDTLRWQDYARICAEINMQKNRRILFEYLDSKGPQHGKSDVHFTVLVCIGSEASSSKCLQLTQDWAPYRWNPLSLRLRHGVEVFGNQKARIFSKFVDRLQKWSLGSQNVRKRRRDLRDFTTSHDFATSRELAWDLGSLGAAHGQGTSQEGKKDDHAPRRDADATYFDLQCAIGPWIHKSLRIDCLEHCRLTDVPRQQGV